MKRVRIFLISFALLLAIPAFSYAAGTAGFGSPLVPSCGIGSNTNPCQACDLVKLADNLIKFMVGLSVLVASLMFAYAGFLYVTAASDKGHLETAKNIFTNVFIGLILILAAWLIVDLILRTFTGQSLNALTQVQCVQYNNNGGSFSPVRGDQSGPPVTSAGTPTPPAGGVQSGKSVSGVTGTTSYTPCDKSIDPNCNINMEGGPLDAQGNKIVTVQDCKERGPGCVVTVATANDSGVPLGSYVAWPAACDAYGLDHNCVFKVSDHYSTQGCSTGVCTYGQGTFDVATCGSWNTTCTVPASNHHNLGNPTIVDPPPHG